MHQATAMQDYARQISYLECYRVYNISTPSLTAIESLKLQYCENTIHLSISTNTQRS